MQNKPDLHKVVKARVRTTSMLLDRLEKIVKSNHLTIQRARELTERIEALRSQIAERKRALLAKSPRAASFRRISLSVRAKRR